MRRALTLTALAAVLGLAALPTPANAAPATCPSTFEVLHDDAIGSLQLAQGAYTIVLADPTRLSCASASDLFRQFLEDYSGALPRPWKLNAATASFANGKGAGFSVVKAVVPSGGGGGGRYPAGGTDCPSFFTVEHNDHIGSLKVPAGPYRITLLAVGQLSCSKASALLARFLQDFDGVLPRPYRLDPATGTFQASANVGFRIKRAVGQPVSPRPAGTYPSDGTRCAGTFRVVRSDRVGRLRFPAGPYYVTPTRGGGVSCRQASTLFAAFLDRTDGRLPSPWRLGTSNGTFTRGGGPAGFRVKPAR